MRIWLVSIVRRLYACLLFTLLLCAATDAQQTGSIEGRVISEPSGQPLPYAHVKLVGPEKTQINRVDADSSGHFSFENLGAGQYDLFASKAGYSEVTKSCEAEQSSNQPPSRSPNQTSYIPQSGGKFSIAEGQKISGVQVELLAPGMISGTVYDQHGEPLQRASVEAVQSAAFGGRRTFAIGEPAQTDDQGQYRVFGLKPGKYYLRVTAVFSERRRRAEDDPAEFVPIYYPETTDPQAASLIAVKAGEEASGLDFTLKPTGTVKVKGRIVNGFTGETFNDAAATVELLYPGDPDKRGHSLYGFPTGGTFAGNGWVPGTYVFSARSFRPVDHQQWTGWQKVDLSGSNPEEVIIRIFPDVDVRGLVEVPAGTKLHTIDVSVELESRDPSEFGRFPGRAEVQFDGSFTVAHVPAGAYDVEVEPLPEGLFVKSVRQGRADALESGIKISGEGAGEPIAIVLSSMAGEINGTVHTSDGKAACGGNVILIPNEPGRFGKENYPEAEINPTGHFEIRGIPPGAYKAFRHKSISRASAKRGRLGGRRGRRVPGFQRNEGL